MREIAPYLLAATLLTGCVAAPSRTPEAREAIRNFALEARFSLRVSTPGLEAQSAGGRLSWEQKEGQSRLLLSSPLGYGLAEIESTPNHAVLRMANGEVHESNDPDSLMENVTGQRLPVTQLPDWLLGRAGKQSKFLSDFQGRPQQIEEAGWQIDYSYDSDARDALPSQLKLNHNGQIELRLRIEEWKSLP